MSVSETKSLKRPEPHKRLDPSMMRSASRRDAESGRTKCLTEFSLPALIAGALTSSAVLWLAIWAVL